MKSEDTTGINVTFHTGYEQGFFDGISYAVLMKKEEELKIMLQPRPRWMPYKVWRYLLGRLFYISMEAPHD